MFTKLYISAMLLAAKPGDPPDVKPRFDFPGAAPVLLVFSAFLGLLFLGCLAIFFSCLFLVAASFMGKRDGGIGKALAGVVVSAIVGALMLAGSVTFASWTGYFG